MNKDRTENEYLEKLSLGNEEAFRYIFMLYFPKVKYFISHIVKSDNISEDISQDIFEKIWTNREYLTDIKSFNSYVYKMAKNAALNHLDHQFVEQAYLSKYKLPKDITIEEQLEVKELELLIQLTVEKMPPQRKRIFKMSRIENLKNAEIAEKLNLSIKTVENHLTTALKEIREVIMIAIFFFL